MSSIVVLAVIAGVASSTVSTVPTARSQAFTKCEKCHTAKGWLPATFDHEVTGFPLFGKHKELRCATCHGADFNRALPEKCVDCHRDPHAAELGRDCAGCHDENSWESRFDASAHRRTAFPLSGAHAVVPCNECHSDGFTRQFVRASAQCLSCHADDYTSAARTSIDHDAAGFGADCQRCHTATNFQRALYADHDKCFEITRGDHAGIGCRECHSSLEGARPNSGCQTFTAACTSCHEHNRNNTDDEHNDVPGYQYKDRKCYECHRFAVP